MISPGVTLGGRYRLDERIAGGGMGDVWRGTDEVLGRTVAVKILLPALLDEPGFAERFRGEARTMATINHPGVVDVYDYGSDQQLAFLVMEYVEGDALSRTLSRVGRLTPARTMALVAQAADALQAAHANGIVHRDVKPGNLLVRPNGTLVLTDFGIARSALVGQLTVAGSVLGTASYISPEQAAGGVATRRLRRVRARRGRLPVPLRAPAVRRRHADRDRHEARPGRRRGRCPADIPPAVRAIVDRALAKDPAARWPTAAAMADGGPAGRVALATTSQQPAATAGPAPPGPVSPAARPPVGAPRPACPARRSRGSARAAVPAGAPARLRAPAARASVPSGPPVAAAAYRQPSAAVGQYRSRPRRPSRRARAAGRC